MGLRKEGNFKLSSGINSNIFWDISKLYSYSYWMRIEAIKEFIWEIGLLNPWFVQGIERCGMKLAEDIGNCLDISVLTEDRYVRQNGKRGGDSFDNIVIIDDVLTTGSTVQRVLNRSRGGVIGIAVLINRSRLGIIDGIPITSGIGTDIVEVGK